MQCRARQSDRCGRSIIMVEAPTSLNILKDLPKSFHEADIESMFRSIDNLILETVGAICRSSADVILTAMLTHNAWDLLDDWKTFSIASSILKHGMKLWSMFQKSKQMQCTEHPCLHAERTKYAHHR